MLFSNTSRKGGFLFFLFSILSTLLLLSSQVSTAVAAPVNDIGTLVPRDKNIPDKAEVEKLVKPENLHEFSKYAKNGQPPKDKAIYFTSPKDGPRNSPRTVNDLIKWANSQQLTSVRNIWKNANFHTRGQYKEVDENTFAEFQNAFSKYYAQQTDGKAYLIFPHDKEVSETSIFYKAEFTEIKSHGKVDEIIWIDLNKIHDKDYDWKDEKKTYWKKH